VISNRFWSKQQDGKKRILELLENKPISSKYLYEFLESKYHFYSKGINRKKLRNSMRKYRVQQNILEYILTRVEHPVDLQNYFLGTNTSPNLKYFRIGINLRLKRQIKLICGR
jgi:hypothetical protein